MSPSADILSEVLDRITSDFQFKDNGAWLQKGRCPACSRKELFTRKDGPWILRCGRADNCGHEVSVREQYPDIFDTWSNRFKTTEAEPNAAADAYLHHKRGLNLLGMRAAYSQETYYDPDRRITSATIRFPLPAGGHWERLIDQPGRFDKKAHFKKGSTWGGHWWQAPDQPMDVLAAANDIWICEGIFDAWALRDAGLVAVSAMSCNNWPEKSLADLRRAIAALDLKKAPRLVFAFDIGKAGTEYTRKFVERAQEQGWKATAAQPRPEGEFEKLDWNDLKNRDALKPDDIAGYLWNGRVLLAQTAVEKAILLYEKHEWASFSFVHQCRTFWASFNAAKIAETVEKEGITPKAAAKSCAEVTEVANCAFRVLYFQENQAIDESHYYLRIDFPRATAPIKRPFSGAAITSASEFKKRLASCTPGGLWEGSTRQLDRMMRQQNGKLKTVETLDFTGYSRVHEAWVLDTIAVHKGRVVRMNDEDYFDLGKTQLKLAAPESNFSIDYDADAFDTTWLAPFWTAFRENGLVTLSFWVMSLFAEQIRREQKSLGFLEMSGLPGTGKSTLIEFLWKLVGRENYEGFDPAKSTLAAYTRNLSRVANLPVVFMEADRSDDQPHSKKFDWDEIKPLFNGRIGRARGVRNAGNETYEPPFRGALVIEQNYPVNGSPAVMQRIMPLNFTKDGWSEATKAAAGQIEQWPVEDISGTIIHLIKREADYLAKFRAVFKPYEQKFLAGSTTTTKVRDGRIRHNHAQLHAGLDALAALLPLPAEAIKSTHALIDTMAITRDRSLEADHPIVADFWETYDYLEDQQVEGSLAGINQHRKPDQYIAVNLNDFESRCRKANITAPAQDQLKKHLKSSKSRPFLEIKTVNSPDAGGVHCWVFRHPDAVAQRKGA